MSIEPPASDEPRRPSGPRNPGDAWVVLESGERYWGRFGAAGLLAFDRTRRAVLLQHRVSWSHFGGTWALPGGALHEGESALTGALREAREEAGVPAGAVEPRFVSVLDLDVWSYTTVVGDVMAPFEPAISDPESYALEWVGVDEVVERPLHPAFDRAWSHLRSLLAVRPVVLVDVANVVGSVPDGWWRDRAGAASRLLARLGALAEDGVDAAALGLRERTWFPAIVAVVEGAARGADEAAGVRLVRAEASGDDALVTEARALVADDYAVTAVTSDRALSARLAEEGAAVRGARWLLDLLDAGDPQR